MPKQLTKIQKLKLRTAFDQAASTAGQSITTMIETMEEIDEASCGFKLKQALLQLRVAYSRARLKL